jgi:multisubunit Na+/H+ antiporter MnhC subunit
VRAALATAVVAAVIGAAVVARDPRTQTIVALPSQSTAIVVLDVSASVSSDTYSRIGTTLSELAGSEGRYGLVVFSDQAYEALPPGSPAEALRPLVRYFTLPRQVAPGFAPQFPPNPWARSFTAGTRISAGLSLAHDIAINGGLRRPAVVLVSDLDDDPKDVQRLASILLAYRRDRIPVQVVALNASEEDLALFTRVLGRRQTIVRASPTEPGGAPQNHTPVPWALIALALVTAAALAVFELWSPRLEWGRAAS